MKKKYDYHLKTRADIFLYIGEIVLMFGSFCFLITIADPFLTYNEPSYLKKIIDFFTVYQIGVLVIFKLINAREIREYKRQLSIIETIKYHVDVKRSIDDTVEYIQYLLTNHLPPDIELRYNKILEILKSYDEVLVSDEKTGGETKESARYFATLHAVLSSFSIKINNEIETLSNEWEASIFLRKVRLTLKNKTKKQKRNKHQLKNNLTLT